MDENKKEKNKFHILSNYSSIRATFTELAIITSRQL